MEYDFQKYCLFFTDAILLRGKKLESLKGLNSKLFPFQELIIPFKWCLLIWKVLMEQFYDLNLSSPLPFPYFWTALLGTIYTESQMERKPDPGMIQSQK